MIQRFEFTFDFAHKMLRRVLEATEPEDISALSFAGLIRTGWEQGLVPSEWRVWHEFRDMRNKTSHTYDEHLAKLVAANVDGFLAEAKALLENLEGRLSE